MVAVWHTTLERIQTSEEFSGVKLVYFNMFELRFSFLSQVFNKQNKKKQESWLPAKSRAV